MGSVARQGADFVPFVGSGLDIYEGVRDGNGWQVATGAGGMILDATTMGAGGAIVKGSAKALLKEGAEQGVKYGKTGFTNLQLIQKSATLEERAVGKSQVKAISKKASSSVGKIVSNTTAKKGNAIQLTFKEKISASQMYKLMNPKVINLNKSGGFISPNGIKWQYYKGGTTNPTGWTIKGVTPNKQTIIMRFSK